LDRSKKQLMRWAALRRYDARPHRNFVILQGRAVGFLLLQ
jgi:hypothetical protein